MLLARWITTWQWPRTPLTTSLQARVPRTAQAAQPPPQAALRQAPPVLEVEPEPAAQRAPEPRSRPPAVRRHSRHRRRSAWLVCWLWELHFSYRCESGCLVRMREGIIMVRHIRNPLRIVHFLPRLTSRGTDRPKCEKKRII
jgi:hypothetical protein